MSPIRSFICLTALAATSAFAGEAVKCAATGSPTFLAGKAAADAGHLNLAFLSLDRAVRASASKADPSEFIAALECLDQVQERSAVVDLPNYDRELSQISARAKSPEATAAIAHYAFRSALQRISSGATSEKAIGALRPLLKSSAFYDAAATGLIAAANADHAAAKPALWKASELSGDAKATFKAELKLALARAYYASGENAAAVAEYEALYKIGAPMQDALIESAWTQLRAKNYAKSIGLSYELTTGKLAQFFAPEAIAIRAISFVENCRYAEARSSIARFKAEYMPISQWLKKAAKGEHSLYETALARSEGAVGAEAIPEKVWSMWSSSDVFVSLQTGIRGAFAEERAAAEWIADQAPAVKAAYAADLKLLPTLRARAAKRIETALGKLDAGMAKRIATESERIRFVNVEASEGAGRDLVYRNANPGLADVEKKVEKADKKAKSYRGKLAWGPVKAEDPSAEMWIDEIGNFEAATLDRCKAKAEYQKAKNSG